MFIAMNRFRIASDKEEVFIGISKNRKTRLNEVPGFKTFNLLQDPTNEDDTLFASHSEWESAEAFENWTKSRVFSKAHANAGDVKEICLGPPQFEGFEMVL